MRNASPWTHFKQGIGQDLQRVGDRLGPGRARVQDAWRSLSLPCTLFFVVVGLGLLIILARQRFPWDALSVVALSQAPWPIGAIGIGFALIVLLFLLWRLPKWKAARLNLSLKEQFDVENETRKTWATITGGMAVLFSLLFTWGNLRVAQDNLRITQKATTKSQELTRKGQITDRFTRAIAQLADRKLEIRVAAIYVLERIAKESSEEHWPIMEVLTTYIRVNAPWPAREEQIRALTERLESVDQIRATGEEREILGMGYAVFLHNRAMDIHAALTVLGRHTLSYETEEQRLVLILTDLSGANLTGAHLERAILGGAHLENAKLYCTHLQGHTSVGLIWNGQTSRECT